MYRLLTCPRGHQWELVGAEAQGPTRHFCCPECGQAPGDPAPPGREDTDPSHPDPGDHARQATYHPHDAFVREDSATMMPADDASRLEGTPDVAVPGYELLGEIGRGGMGVVYKARHVGLNRFVALKMILSGAHAGARERLRFRTEAEAVAKLQHPNIVQVYDVGEFDLRPYLSLEYVGGGTLAQRLGGEPLPLAWSVGLVVELARAMQFAHERGVIHRDLKPSNVLLAPSDVAPTPLGVPKIADFGLAKQLDGAGPTQTEAIMGTPAYMAPEQVAGKTRAIGPAADQYALGVILYEMLTGRPPFCGETKLDTLEMARSQEALPPSRLQPRMPRDLDTITLKCLEKEPQRRYDNAGALADDLQRFLDGAPIVARPVGRAERVSKWARRRPAVAALLAALVVVFVAGFVGVTVAYLQADAARRGEAEQRAQAEEARDDAETARRVAVTARDQALAAREREAEQRHQATSALTRAETAVYYSQIAQARMEWRANNAAAAQQLLGDCRDDRRGWEWRHLRHAFHGDLRTLEDGHGSGYVYALAYGSEDRHLVSAGGGNPFYEVQGPASIRPGEVVRWDTATGTKRGVLRGHENLVKAVAVAPSGGLVASTGPDATVRVWSEGTGTVRVLPGPKGGTCVAFDSAGLQVAAGFTDGAVRVWDTATGELRRAARGFGGPVLALGTTPEGQFAVLSGGSPSCRLWMVDDARLRASLPVADGFLAAAFGPGAVQVATAEADGRVNVWDGLTGRKTCSVAAHVSQAQCVAFSPDGALVASGGGDNRVRVHRVADGAEVVSFRGHHAPLLSVAWSPSGRQLAAAGQGRSVRLWDVTSDPEQERVDREVPRDGQDAVALAFTSDSDRLRTVRITGRVLERALPGGTPSGEWSVDVTSQWLVPSAMANFSGDGRALATITGTGLLHVYALPSGMRRFEVLPCRGHTWRVALDRTGDHVAAEGWERDGLDLLRVVRVWAVDSGTLVGEFRRAWWLRNRVWYGGLALRSDGRVVAFPEFIPTADGRSLTQSVRIYEVRGGVELLRLPESETMVAGVVFSPDGQRLAVSGRNGSVAVWNAATGGSLARAQATHTVEDLSFTPDGARLAGATREQVLLWDTATGREVLTLRGGPPRPRDNGFNPRVVFSPDGRRLATVNWDQTVSVWEAPEDGAGTWRRRCGAAARAFDWHLREARSATGPEAVAFHLRQLRALEPPTPALRLERARLRLRHGEWPADDVAEVGPELQLQRANLLAEAGRWQEAEADYREAFGRKLPSDPVAWLGYALVQLELGDREGWRQTSARMLHRFRGEGAWTMGLAVLACGAAPGGVDAASLVAVARQTPRSNEKPHARALALALFRAGRTAEADKVLGPAPEKMESMGELEAAIRALVAAQRGDAAEAQRWRKARGARPEEWWSHRLAEWLLHDLDSAPGS